MTTIKEMPTGDRLYSPAQQPEAIAGIVIGLMQLGTRLLPQLGLPITALGLFCSGARTVTSTPRSGPGT